MTTTDVLGSAAITMSLTAALACLISVPLLFQKGADLHFEMSEGMNEFKEMTDDAWHRLIHLKNGQTVKGRAPRQLYGHCHCYDSKSRTFIEIFYKNYLWFFR